MTYTAADLVVFNPLVNPPQRAGNQYFELHPNELPSVGARSLPGSLFIRDAAFDFYAACFHSASESFNYFSFQRFDASQIEHLKLALDHYLKDLKDDTARGQLFSRYASVVSPTLWNNIETRTLTAAAFHCGQTIRAFIELRTRQSGCLWVLGI